ncbi:MAG: hypothetical protein EXS64_15555 [Candidatus Latescibacteria bacterium]|nr:hypothetical protein [Candidatus Latescibacterota bacterium]
MTRLPESASSPAVSADEVKAFEDCADESDKDPGGGGDGLNSTIIAPSTIAKDRNMKMMSCVGGLNFMAKPRMVFHKRYTFGGKKRHVDTHGLTPVALENQNSTALALYPSFPETRHIA